MNKRLGLISGLVLVAAGAVLTRRRLLLVTVQGGSMKPALADGDRLFMARVSGRSARPGDIVTLRVPATEAGTAGRLYVKRVAAIAGEPIPDQVPAGASAFVPTDHLVVLGDWPESLDSRTWGCIPNDWVIGVATRRRRDVIDLLKARQP